MNPDYSESPDAGLPKKRKSKKQDKDSEEPTKKRSKKSKSSASSASSSEPEPIVDIEHLDDKVTSESISNPHLDTSLFSALNPRPSEQNLNFDEHLNGVVSENSNDLDIDMQVTGVDIKVSE